VALITLSVPIWLTGSYPLHLAITILMFSTAALGARLLLQTGVWSFGQGVFLAIGAYIAAIGILRADLSFWILLPVAGVIAAVIAAVLGYPSLRLKGVYFGIFTMVLVFAVRELIFLTPKISGGTLGLNEVPAFDPIDISSVHIAFDNKTANYYVIAFIFLLTFVVMRRIDRSRVGNILSAIRQNETLAASTGISISRYRVGAFALAAFFAGLAGAFSAGYLSVAHAEIWGLWPSIFIVAYAIIGGIASPLGPVAGSAAAIIGVEILRSTQSWQSILLGVSLIVVVLIVPNGLMSIVDTRNGPLRAPVLAARRWFGRADPLPGPQSPSS
jgi:branched-chain amino acid transport system permease protein